MAWIWFYQKVKLNDKFNLNFDFFPGVYMKNNEVDLRRLADV